jgi:hypothetical protein
MVFSYRNAASTPPMIGPRILVANTPLMYRETLALTIHRHNPDFEVMIADPAFIDGEAERFGPQALIRDDDGAEIGAPDGVVLWVWISIDGDHLDARIGADGKVSEIHDVESDDMLTALDEANRFFSKGDG